MKLVVLTLAILCLGTSTATATGPKLTAPATGRTVQLTNHDKSNQQTRSRRPAHYWAWLCIHRYEGSWTDSGDPYWGGLQMDRGFMYTYGGDMIRKYHGFANRWSPLDQMWVAERAYRSRGFYPWPNTARYCGLI